MKWSMSAWPTSAVANASALARRNAPNEPTSSICDISGASEASPEPSRYTACSAPGRSAARSALGDDDLGQVIAAHPPVVQEAQGRHGEGGVRRHGAERRLELALRGAGVT